MGWPGKREFVRVLLLETFPADGSCRSFRSISRASYRSYARSSSFCCCAGIEGPAAKTRS